MSKADRIAKAQRVERKRREAAGKRAQKRDAPDKKRASRTEAESLIARALELCQRHEMDELRSYQVTPRYGGRMLAKDRACWYVGSVSGGLGYGESGQVGVYVTTAGDLLYSPNTNGPQKPVTLEFFEGARLGELIESVRKKIARLEQLEEPAG